MGINKDLRETHYSHVDKKLKYVLAFLAVGFIVLATMGSWAPEHALLSEKDRTMAMIICGIALMLGAHRLYLHYTMKKEDGVEDEK